MIVEQAPPQRVYRPRGAAWSLFYAHNGRSGEPLEDFDEVLFEGVAGGGKSLAIAMFIHRACLKYPGIQVLFCRKYRDTMSESCMKTFEEEVLRYSMPTVCEGRDRTQRAHYQYPNGSRIVCVGSTDEEKIKSTAWEIIWVNEATDLSIGAYEMILSRKRAGGDRVSPYSLLIADCNPKFKGHFLNQRFPTIARGIKVAHGYVSEPTEGLTRLRLITSHKDNPTYWDDDLGEWKEEGRRYMATLDSLTSVRREQLYLGHWCSAEGLVYNEFDPAYHVIKRSELPAIEYYFGSVDWGYRNAGVIQIWGVDKEQSMYLVHETYRAMETVDFWANEAVKLYLEFKPIAYVCDPASPDKRAQFNDRLSRFRGGKISRLAIEANNDREAGVQEVKSALQRAKHGPKCDVTCTREDRHGKARLFFCADALRSGRDPVLASLKGRSVCTLDEIQELSWLQTQDGKEIKEKWDESIPHDGLDATRYAAMFNWKRKAVSKKSKNPYPVGTFGHRLWETGLKMPYAN